MTTGIVSAVYLSAAVFFIFFLRGLSVQESVWRSACFVVPGMVLTVFATVFGLQFDSSTSTCLIVLSALAGGTALAAYVANPAWVTEVQLLVAGLHFVVCLAAVFVGFNAHFVTLPVIGTNEVPRAALEGFAGILAPKTAVDLAIMKVGVGLGILIGAATLTGWIAAFGRLSGKIGGQALKLPGELNFAGALMALIFLSIYLGEGHSWALLVLVVAALFVGFRLFMCTGEADMPMVLAILNSCSGWAAAAIGLTLGNEFLVITGTMIGTSGAILTHITCKVMSRSFVLFILGDFDRPTAQSSRFVGVDRYRCNGISAGNEALGVNIVPSDGTRGTSTEGTS